MSFGFAFNDLVLSDHKAYCITESGNQDTFYEGSSGYYGLAFYGKDYVQPGTLFAMRGTNGNLYSYRSSVNWYNYRLYAWQPVGPWTWVVTDSNATNFDWCVTKIDSFSPPSGQGLAAFNSQGEVTFNSSDPLLVITDKIEIPVDINTPESIATYTVHNPHNVPLWAVLPSRAGVTLRLNSSQLKFIFAEFEILSTTQVRVTIHTAVINSSWASQNPFTSSSLVLLFGVTP